MAIRVIKRGEVKCDKCSKVLASISASEEVFKVLEQEERFVKIQCYNCNPARLPQ